MDWLVGVKVTARHKGQRVLEFLYSSAQLPPQGDDGTVTRHDIGTILWLFENNYSLR